MKTKKAALRVQRRGIHRLNKAIPRKIPAFAVERPDTSHLTAGTSMRSALIVATKVTSRPPVAVDIYHQLRLRRQQQRLELRRKPSPKVVAPQPRIPSQLVQSVRVQ